VYNQIDLSSSATDDKLIFLAFWPDKPDKPEVWTYSKAEEAFGDMPQVMDMIRYLSYGEEMYHEESNFALMRIPSWVDYPKHKYKVQ
jgi:hypothetical protein|tara:strand:+ start:515 stop:775 length:261 start_codon:yes stop_codon:yes gene_type:complete